MIQNGGNGFVCRNSSDFVSAIRRAKDENNKHLVETAYDNILHHYNTKTMAEDLCGGIELLIVFVTVKGEYADCAATGRMVAA